MTMDWYTFWGLVIGLAITVAVVVPCLWWRTEPHQADSPGIHWCQGCNGLVKQRWMEWKYGAWLCWTCSGRGASVPAWVEFQDWRGKECADCWDN